MLKNRKPFEKALIMTSLFFMVFMGSFSLFAFAYTGIRGHLGRMYRLGWPSNFDMRNDFRVSWANDVAVDFYEETMTSGNGAYYWENVVSEDPEYDSEDNQYEKLLKGDLKNGDNKWSMNIIIYVATDWSDASNYGTNPALTGWYKSCKDGVGW